MVTPGSFVAPTRLTRERFQPNFDLMMKSMMANQQFYDKAMEALGKSANAASPKDAEYRDKVKAEYDALASQVTESYMNEGVETGQQQLRTALQSIKKDVAPGGRYYELEKNYAAAQEAMKEQRKRVNEGKLTDAAYYMSVVDPLSRFQTFNDDGTTNSFSITPRQDSIKLDEFAAEFLKHKEADLEEQHFERGRDESGNIVWRKQGHKQIKQEELMRELSAAYRNATRTTGQLMDEYKYTQRMTGITPQDYIQGKNAELMQGKQELEQALNDLENKKENPYLQALVANQKYLRDDDKESISTRNKIKSQLQAQIDSYQHDINKLLELDTPEKQSRGAYDLWENQKITQAILPYAEAKSYDNITTEMKTARNWYTTRSSSGSGGPGYFKGLVPEDWRNLSTMSTNVGLKNHMANLNMDTPVSDMNPVTRSRFGLDKGDELEMSLASHNITASSPLGLLNKIKNLPKEELDKIEGASFWEKTANAITDPKNQNIYHGFKHILHSYLANNTNAEIIVNENGRRSSFTRAELLNAEEMINTSNPTVAAENEIMQSAKKRIAFAAATLIDGMSSHSKKNLVYKMFGNKEAIDEVTKRVMGEGDVTGIINGSTVTVLGNKGKLNAEDLKKIDMSAVETTSWDEYQRERYATIREKIVSQQSVLKGSGKTVESLDTKELPAGGFKGSQVVGIVKPGNALGVPTGYIVNIKLGGSDSETILVHDINLKADEYYRPINELAKDFHAFKETENPVVLGQMLSKDGTLEVHEGKILPKIELQNNVGKNSSLMLMTITKYDKNNEVISTNDHMVEFDAYIDMMIEKDPMQTFRINSKNDTPYKYYTNE